MWVYCCLFGACSSLLCVQGVFPGLRLAMTSIAPVSAIALDQMQTNESWTGSVRLKLNYKQVKKDELAVCKDTRSNLKLSALMPLARLGAPRAPRERLARGGTRLKIHFPLIPVDVPAAADGHRSVRNVGELSAATGQPQPSAAQSRAAPAAVSAGQGCPTLVSGEPPGLGRACDGT